MFQKLDDIDLYIFAIAVVVMLAFGVGWGLIPLGIGLMRALLP